LKKGREGTINIKKWERGEKSDLGEAAEMGLKNVNCTIHMLEDTPDH